MLAFNLSGIDLKTFALSTYFIKDTIECLICLDTNNFNNIIMIESNQSIQIDDYKLFYVEGKKEVSHLLEKFKSLLIKQF